jgi:hypothetical protein
MENDCGDERKIRAARNQSIFRAVNEQMRKLNETFGELTNTYTVACECASISCVEHVQIQGSEYEAVRANPRQFVVLPGHVVPEVEIVVRETPGYVVVEKLAVAGELAEELVPQAD